MPGPQHDVNTAAHQAHAPVASPNRSPSDCSSDRTIHLQPGAPASAATDSPRGSPYLPSYAGGMSTAFHAPQAPPIDTAVALAPALPHAMISASTGHPNGGNHHPPLPSSDLASSAASSADLGGAVAFVTGHPDSHSISQITADLQLLDQDLVFDDALLLSLLGDDDPDALALLSEGGFAFDANGCALDSAGYSHPLTPAFNSSPFHAPPTFAGAAPGTPGPHHHQIAFAHHHPQHAGYAAALATAGRAHPASSPMARSPLALQRSPFSLSPITTAASAANAYLGARLSLSPKAGPGWPVTSWTPFSTHSNAQQAGLGRAAAQQADDARDSKELLLGLPIQAARPGSVGAPAPGSVLVLGQPAAPTIMVPTPHSSSSASRAHTGPRRPSNASQASSQAWGECGAAGLVLAEGSALDVNAQGMAMGAVVKEEEAGGGQGLLPGSSSVTPEGSVVANGGEGGPGSGPRGGKKRAARAEGGDQSGGGGGGGGANKKPRSSVYRGVTKHRRSGRWEAHIWVKEVGRQIYLGGYENEEHAAEAYDVATLKVKGKDAKNVKTNFDTSRYADLMGCMDSISLDELIMAVRRQSQGFSRGSSTYRGVTAHPSGRWEARIGIPGSKHIYLGLFDQEGDAAKAYDRALVRLRGTNAATNNSLSEYKKELQEHSQHQTLLQNVAATGCNAEFERWIKSGNDGEEGEGDDSSLAAGAGSAAVAIIREGTSAPVTIPLSALPQFNPV